MTLTYQDPDMVAIRPVCPRTHKGCEECLQRRYAVGTSAAMPNLWTRRLLRLVTDAARLRSLPCQ